MRIYDMGSAIVQNNCVLYGECMRQADVVSGIARGQRGVVYVPYAFLGVRDSNIAKFILKLD